MTSLHSGERAGTGEIDRDIPRLYRTFQRLLAEQSVNGREVLHQVILQPASLSKLKFAACRILKSRASRHDLLADVMQEAMTIVTQRFNNGEIPYVDQGLDRFEGWLATIWRNASLEVWKRFRITLEKQRPLAGHESCLEAPPENHDDRHELLELIDAMEDLVLRAVMTDWAAGFNGPESARLRGLSRSAFYRSRQKGLQYLRRKFHAHRPPGINTKSPSVCRAS